MPPSFSVAATYGDVSLLALAGELDRSEADAALLTLRACIDRCSATVELDFSNLEFIDGAGLRCIERAHEYAIGSDRTLRVVGASPHVRRVMEVVGISDLLD
jgi:anti-anti-sigma factor